MRIITTDSILNAGHLHFEMMCRLQEALENAGIGALFPVQVAVWNQVMGPAGCERDLCICSPTGSGKTLSYALPIVQLLSTRVLCRLRALVVLPTRDLAIQVTYFMPLRFILILIQVGSFSFQLES